MSHSKLITIQQNLKKNIFAQSEAAPSREEGTIHEDEAQAGLNLLEKRWSQFEANNDELAELNEKGELDNEAYFLENWYQEICRV